MATVAGQGYVLRCQPLPPTIYSLVLHHSQELEAAQLELVSATLHSFKSVFGWLGEYGHRPVSSQVCLKYVFMMQQHVGLLVSVMSITHCLNHSVFTGGHFVTLIFVTNSMALGGGPGVRTPSLDQDDP